MRFIDSFVVVSTVGLRAGWNGRWGCGWVVGALLGPEGTGLSCFFSRPVVWVPPGFSGLVCAVLVVGLLFEICIVDASIFFLGFLCVSFQGRMVDALVPGADEGRGRLR